METKESSRWNAKTSFVPAGSTLPAALYRCRTIGESESGYSNDLNLNPNAGMVATGNNLAKIIIPPLSLYHLPPIC